MAKQLLGKEVVGALNERIKGNVAALKEKGIWFFATHQDAKQDYTQVDYKGGIGIVIGSEGSGVSRIVAEKCDFLISIPMKGEINSLNASVAAGVIMYEALKQRG